MNHQSASRLIHVIEHLRFRVNLEIDIRFESKTNMNRLSSITCGSVANNAPSNQIIEQRCYVLCCCRFNVMNAGHSRLLFCTVAVYSLIVSSN